MNNEKSDVLGYSEDTTKWYILTNNLESDEFIREIRKISTTYFCTNPFQIRKIITENVELHQELSKANDKLKKIEQLIENYSCIYKKGFPNHLLLVVRGDIFEENQYLELDTVLDDFEKIIKESDE